MLKKAVVKLPDGGTISTVLGLGSVYWISDDP